MSFDLYQCPLPTALVTIPPAAVCPIRFDQIQRFFFQRIQVTPSFTPTTILLSATITPLLTAADGTKMVTTPKMPAVVIPQSELLTEGGNDNSTIDGVPRFKGLGFVNVTANLLNVPAATADAFRKLFAETAQNSGTNLWVYYVTKAGQILGKLVSTTVQGFPVTNLFVSDPGTEGFGADNVFKVSFYMEGGWSEGFALYKPTDYNALTIA